MFLLASVSLFVFALTLFKRKRQQALVKIGTQSAEDSFYITHHTTFGAKPCYGGGSLITTLGCNGYPKNIFQNETHKPLADLYASTILSKQDFVLDPFKKSSQK